MIGQRLGSFEIVAKLGEGGMGEVYRARDTRLQRDVAIKVLPAAFAADADRRARFEREAQTVATLSHPNIVGIFDTGVHDSQLFVVMELLEGETLRERLATGALPVRKAIEYGVQIARGLAAAHAKGLIHRDLKPENIFLLTDGQVKILDFGLARQTMSAGAGSGASETVAAMTDPGTVMGTVGYMAPEQVRGGAVDARTDLFAFGAVLYEMLSGQRAFQRDTAAETMTAILREDPPELSTSKTDLVSGARSDRPPLPRKESGRAIPDRARCGVRARGIFRHVGELERGGRAAGAEAIVARRGDGGHLPRHRHHHRDRPQELARASSRRRQRHVQHADLRSAVDHQRSIRARRPDGRVQRRSVRERPRSVRRPAGHLGAATAGPAPHTSAVHLEVRRAGRADERQVQQPSPLLRHAHAHDDGWRGAAVDGAGPRGRLVAGRFDARNCPRPRHEGSARISSRQDPAPVGGLFERAARVARRIARRVLRTSRAVRRSRMAEGDRPQRRGHDPGRRILGRRRPGLVARRPVIAVLDRGSHWRRLLPADRQRRWSDGTAPRHSRASRARN